MHSLQHIVWTDIPPSAARLIAARCPRIQLNAQHSRQLPAAADPLQPLDAPYAAMCAGFPSLAAAIQADRLRKASMSGSGGAATAGPGLAERFRQAFIDQESARRAREARQVKKEAQAKLRSSHALREMNQWLDAS